jgi:hypothetical protein
MASQNRPSKGKGKARASRSSKTTPANAPVKNLGVSAPKPAAPVPRDESGLNGDGVRRVSGHDIARIEDTTERPELTLRRPPPEGEAEAVGLDEHDLRDGAAELERDRRSGGAPIDDDDQFDVDDADELLDRELSGAYAEDEEQE